MKRWHLWRIKVLEEKLDAMFDPEAMVLPDYIGEVFLVLFYQMGPNSFIEVVEIPINDRLKILKKLKKHYKYLGD